VNDYILIEYSNSVDFGDILYQNTFENRIYLDADVSKPEYEIVEEGTENGDGEFFPTFQKWAKKYSITFYAQEFLVDALTLMTLHDQITVTLRNGEASNVLDAEVEYKWDSNIECWAEVTLSFVTDYIIRKKCDENSTTCGTAVVSTGGIYDADDGGAGTDKWDYTTSSTNGEIAFFYTGYADGVYSGTVAIPVGFYMLTGGVWVLMDMEDGAFGDITTIASVVFIVKSGLYYYRLPYIVSVTDETGGDATIVAISAQIENTFFQVQYDTGGGYISLGSPQQASAFDLGVTLSPGAGVLINFRILWYTHSCTYGVGNVIAQTIT